MAEVNLRAYAASETIPGPVNVCTGRETSIRELAELINNKLGNDSGIMFEKRRDSDIRKSCSKNKRMRKLLITGQ